MVRQGKSAMRMRILAMLAGILVALFIAAPVSAHANLVRAEPGIGASVPTAPTTVRLSFSEAPEPRYSTITVFDAARERFDNGDPRAAPDDAQSLIVGVRDLPQGVYTVVWKTTSAVDGHTASGTFAFGVGAASVANTAATTTVGDFAKNAPLEVPAKWLALLSVCVSLGILSLSLIIWTPTIAAASQQRGSDETVAESVNQRLGLIMEIALVALVATTVLGVVAQVAKATDRSLIGALSPAALRDYLFLTRTGRIWFLRLLLAIAAAIVLRPERLLLVRTTQARETAAQRAATVVGIALGASVLFTFSLTSHSAATPFWTPFTITMDWLHLLATATWIGGLVGLAATVPLLRSRTAGGRTMLRGTVARFSNMALISVGVLILTGLYSAWVHVGSPNALWPTNYGRALLLKLVLVLALIALGAFNILWVRPRLDARANNQTQERSIVARIMEHFRRSITAEIVLGVTVLLVVAILTGLAPSREARTQTGETNLTQRAKAGDLTIALTPSTLQAGAITYDVFVTKGQPVADADRVTLRFASPELGADETEAVTTAAGDGHYTVSGAYTTLNGNWQTRVIVRRIGVADVSASFTLPIGASSLPSTAANGETPTVTATTLLYGLAIVLAVLAVLGSAAILSRRLTMRSI